jgi:hypothetical protein
MKYFNRLNLVTLILDVSFFVIINVLHVAAEQASVPD